MSSKPMIPKASLQRHCPYVAYERLSIQFNSIDFTGNWRKVNVAEIWSILLISVKSLAAAFFQLTGGVLLNYQGVLLVENYSSVEVTKA